MGKSCAFRTRHARALVAVVGAGLLALWPHGAHAQCEFGSGQWIVGPGQRSAGPQGSVYATLPWDPDGGGPLPTVLVAGGSFPIAGVALVNNIATWDGIEWAPIGEGLNGSISSLAVYNGELIAAGSFTASGDGTLCNRIARWTGSSWEPLGAGVNGTVEALAIFQNRLHVAGLFTMAGGVPANRIASWDGALWRTLGNGGANGGGGADGIVYALTVFNNQLIAGGSFSSANNAANTEALAQWNGTSWSSMGIVSDPDIFGPEVRCMGVWSSILTPATRLYIGGQFESVDGVAVSNVASYPVTQFTAGPWSSPGAGFPADVTEMLVQPVGINDHAVTVNTQRQYQAPLWPGGIYRYASGVWNQFAPEQTTWIGAYGGSIIAGVHGLSRRVGSEWQAFGDGINGRIVEALSVNGELHAFGDFTIADQQTDNGAARLDAAGAWHPLGAGVLGPGMETVISAAPHAGQIFVSGTTTSAQGQLVPSVMRWNGTSWSSVQTGFTQGSPLLESVEGNLYMCLLGRVFQWSGISFVQLALALPGGDASGVLVFNGQLHAFGDDLYRLDGNTWTLVAPSPLKSLRAGIVWNNRMFLTATQMGPSSIYELVGGQLVLSQGNLHLFDYVVFEGRPVGNSGSALAIFDGTGWPIVSTFSGAAYDLLVHGRSLIVAGRTVAFGTTLSPIFGQLVCCPADIDHTGAVNVDDLLDVISGWGPCPTPCSPTSCAADIAPSPMGDCTVDVDDLLMVIGGWGACQ